MILSGAMMLDWLGEIHGLAEARAAADQLTAAVDAAYDHGNLIPFESGGDAGTQQIGDAVRRCLQSCDRIAPATSPRPANSS